MLSFDTDDADLILDRFSVGLAAGWCGPDYGYFCDHFPNGWGYPTTGRASTLVGGSSDLVGRAARAERPPPSMAAPPPTRPQNDESPGRTVGVLRCGARRPRAVS